jgi:hypothetical protein
MMRRSRKPIWLAILVVSLAVPVGAEEKVLFNRDIRPILSNNCYQCHGPDEGQRQAGLRLDDRAAALAALESGTTAIVPGDPKASELIARVTTDDAFLQMPPPDSGKELSDRDRQLLRQWIAQGAEYEGHWAFIAPRMPETPEVSNEQWARTPIDRFILRRLDREGLTPNEEADRRSLIRRVTLDLTGLPPTPGEIEAFLKDTADGAYERLVDRLLASPRYGEHQARYWLDAARYGDTHGLHLDNYREMWPYRDWVINAYNSNLPFDEFVKQQLAGDLLPEATTEQIVASGFNRCNVTTSEGGSIAEEVMVRYASDRAEVFGTVFLGLTVGCAACHSHKFDPISQREFYSLYAFFNSFEEPAMDGNREDTPPVIRVMTEEQKAEEKSLDEKIAGLRRTISERLASIDYEDPGPSSEAIGERADYVWIDDDVPSGAKKAGDGPNWQWVAGDKLPVNTGARSLKQTYPGQGQSYFTEATSPLVVGEGDKLFAYVWLDPASPPKEVMLQWHTGNWLHRAYWGENLVAFGQDNSTQRRHMGPLPKTGEWVRLEVDAAHVGIQPGMKIQGWAFTQFGGTAYFDTAGLNTQTLQAERPFDSLTEWIAYQRKLPNPQVPDSLKPILKKEPDSWNDAQKTQVRNHFLEQVCPLTREVFAPLHAELAKHEARKKELVDTAPTTLVSRDKAKPVPAHLLMRGDYRAKGDVVERGVPAVFPPLKADGTPSRLDLAEWLMRDDHPLTSRVQVNRIWQHYFGTGLVKTSEDFGSQGEWPSHPELLDWLAIQYRDSGWDTKALHRLIVTSAAYRQAARITPEKLQADPYNRLLARGPRFRLDAEVIRDAALFTSGLLVEELGGPSVKPYQPPGLWEAVGYTRSNTANFKRDSGEALYRRSVYTFWKRTSPPPGMALFDAPTRESCTVRRSRTNTPLQALNLMNDEQYIEAARHLAARIIRDGGETVSDRATYGFEIVTGRKPEAEELTILEQAYQGQLAGFQADEKAATELLSVGESPRDASLPAAEHAAWTMIGNLLLNLDETITKG